MYCSTCGADMVEGQDCCPACSAPVAKPGFLRRMAGALFTWLTDVRTSTVQVRRVERIEITDPRTGKQRVFHSLEDLPPEVRAQVEASRGQGHLIEERESITDAQGVKLEMTRTPSGVKFLYRDASGKEQTYLLPKDMPPEVRAIYERMEKALPAEIRKMINPPPS